jgi:hypothetical protein
MEMRAVKKWLTFFFGILAAIVIADRLSAIIVSAVGITGSGRFVLSFILYAALFFAVLYAIERIAGIRFFNLGLDT